MASDQRRSGAETGGAPEPGAREPDSDEQPQSARTRQVALIGRRIRALRRERMTLAQLAEASNVSVGLLSRLENGVGNPSLASLSAIARVLEVDISSFFEPPGVSGLVLTSDDRVKLNVPRTGVDLELLAPGFHGRIIGMLMTLPPGYCPDEQVSASPGEQVEVVLDGSVEFRIEHEVHRLEEGDTILFEASRPHSRRNLSTESAATVLACSTEARLESYFPAG